VGRDPDEDFNSREVKFMPQQVRDDQIWVSALNREQNIRPQVETKQPVRFYDTTLRDGEQTVGVVLDPQQKLQLALQLDTLGVSRIEAGFPRVSSEDGEAIRLIQQAHLKAEVWGFARAARADIDELARLEMKFSVIEIPTSDIKLKAYGIPREEAVRRAADAVEYAKKHGIYVAFFPVDSTRADLDFLRTIYLAARDAGADEAVVVDTIGACGPEAVEFLIRKVREWLGEKNPVHFHGHNDFGLATACAIAAVRAGAAWIQGTINGMGERAGNADLGEVALALRCLYDVPVSLDLTQIRRVSRIVREAGRYELEPWKPLVGENLFSRESGAVASQFHIPEAIEPFSAELVGADRHIVLGKKSGLDSISLKAKDLGVEVSESQRAAVLAAVKSKGIATRRLVTDSEFRTIVQQVCGG
jgi:isopropylmalate/homocitrate/citramalate synthase